ncbi:hypothetical protein AB4589_11605 [Vibrio sp. 10N.222.49.A3]|uniref:hypothetical protein n=1 Tax=Vibrio sp. 10N.222.49.A3 TaxID=3229611 RepID=UPI00354E794C
MENSVRKLHSEQTTSFDTEYIDQKMFEILVKQLDMLYPTRQSFHLLDIGGGNGVYADKILSHYTTWSNPKKHYWRKIAVTLTKS